MYKTTAMISKKAFKLFKRLFLCVPFFILGLAIGILEAIKNKERLVVAIQIGLLYGIFLAVSGEL